MKAKQTLPSNAEITKFEMLNELISSIYIEMKEFSKKKPDDALNAFKVKNVNRVLTQLKDFLINQPTVSFLDLLDDEILPSKPKFVFFFNLMLIKPLFPDASYFAEGFVIISIFSIFSDLSVFK